MSSYVATLETAQGLPIYRAALDALERHAVAAPTGSYLLLTADEVSVYEGHPDEGGIILSGPHALGSGAGLTATEAATYVRGYTRATVGATEHVDWTASLDDDGDWLVELRSGGPLRSWTIAAGAEPGVPVAVLL